MSRSSRQFLAIFGLIAVTVVWGTTFILVKWIHPVTRYILDKIVG